MKSNTLKCPRSVHLGGFFQGGLRVICFLRQCHAGITCLCLIACELRGRYSSFAKVLDRVDMFVSWLCVPRNVPRAAKCFPSRKEAAKEHTAVCHGVGFRVERPNNTFELLMWDMCVCLVCSTAWAQSSGAGGWCVHFAARGTLWGIVGHTRKTRQGAGQPAGVWGGCGVCTLMRVAHCRLSPSPQLWPTKSAFAFRKYPEPSLRNLFLSLRIAGALRSSLVWQMALAPKRRLPTRRRGAWREVSSCAVNGPPAQRLASSEIQVSIFRLQKHKTLFRGRRKNGHSVLLSPENGEMYPPSALVVSHTPQYDPPRVLLLVVEIPSRQPPSPHSCDPPKVLCFRESL